jgi:hypothetical protein
MVQFKPGQTIVTDKPKLAVEVELPPGQYRFQLIVIDEQGNESSPIIQTVVIAKSREISDIPRRPDIPRLPITPRRPNIPSLNKRSPNSGKGFSP